MRPPPRPFVTWDDYRRQLWLFGEEDVMGCEARKLGDDGVVINCTRTSGPVIQRHPSDAGKIVRWCDSCGCMLVGRVEEIAAHAASHAGAGRRS
jgi:hypothetical protein